MKKKVVTNLLCFSFFFASTAVPVYAEDETVKELESLIQKGVRTNKEKIRELSWNLTTEERRMIAFKYSKQTFIPEILNIFLGFGVGSYLQGDKLGGVIGTLGGLGFFTSLTGSIVYLATTNGSPPIESYGWFVATGITGIFYATFEVLRPISFARIYNDELFDALMAKENVTFTIFPTLKSVSDPFSNRKMKDFENADVGAVALVTYHF